MEQTEIVLTPAERLILNSYRDLVCGLEDYLGIGYEIVLHSLESMEALCHCHRQWALYKSSRGFSHY